LTSRRELDECEAKRRILREYPHKPEKTLQFVFSLQVEQKILKGIELETIYATA
jgi:hypothetical protein